MHPNPAFRNAPRERNIEFARQRSFGTLAVNASNGPLISHVPFQLSEDGSFLEAHLVRSNPIARLLEKQATAVVAVSGGDTYLSPDWYEIDNQVPTWNYIAVHLRGQLRKMPNDSLPDVLERLSENMERRLLPKKPWSIGKMDPDILSRLLRQIVPVAMDVTEIDGTWKLSQNKDTEIILRAARAAGDAGIGSEVETIAKLMQAEATC